MSLRNRLKSLLKILKVSSLIGCTGFFVAYQIRQTYKTIDSIVNANVLDIEKKHTAEYIYIDDPSYSMTLKKERDKENKQSVGFNRIWKSLKHSLAWRLLWLCRHGNREQRNLALEQLAAFQNNKVWDCLKLAQAIDKTTGVLLARTRGADLRYFLPPPIHVRRAANSPELLSYKLHDLIAGVQALRPHSCIQHFLSKHFANVQEQAMEADNIPAKPDTVGERELCILCLDALHHHISLFNSKDYEEDDSAALLIKMGLLPRLAELLLRNSNDIDVDLAVLRILTVLSVHTNLLEDFFQNGLIRELARLLRSDDVRLSSSAAVCLANLSGEHSYQPGLYLLHPIYRSNSPPTCDILLVHGLRGGVFVTWRQRDRKCAEPIGLLDVAVSGDCDLSDDEMAQTKFMDADMQQVLEDLIELEDEALLSTVDVVLQDLPIQSKREPENSFSYTAGILYSAQDLLLYYPNDPPDSRLFILQPSNFKLPHESIKIKNKDGFKIHIFLVKQANNSSNVPTMVFFHGNAGNMGQRLSNVSGFYHKLRINIMMVEYRGYGLSEGTPSERGLYIDAQSALDYLMHRTDIDRSKIILFGRSLGGAVAIDLASRLEYRNKIWALVVENTFTSIPDMAQIILKWKCLKILPFFCYKNKYMSVNKVGQVLAPTLVICGSNDTLVPPEMANQLYMRCGAICKKLAVMPGGGHDNTWTCRDYYSSIQQFLINVPHLPMNLGPLLDEEEKETVTRHTLVQTV